MPNFAITGVCGAVARRHLDAIARVSGRVVACVDPHDAAALLDTVAWEIPFFKETVAFERYLRDQSESNRAQYLSVCSPNFVHEADCRVGLRLGADVICEKPVVIHSSQIDGLLRMEEETGRRVWTILQLRTHNKLVALRDKVRASPRPQHDVVLTYVTPRGSWYDVSWKGRLEAAGGIATNIGVHMFDLLGWLFGRAVHHEVHLSEGRRMGGFLELERASVSWFLSVEPSDLPITEGVRGRKPHRTLVVDGECIDFSSGLDDLHARVYERTLAGDGYGLEEARPSIELAGRLRTSPVVRASMRKHPFLHRF